jgi:hypothetical protein
MGKINKNQQQKIKEYLKKNAKNNPLVSEVYVKE